MPILLEEEKDLLIPELRSYHTDFDKTHIEDIESLVDKEISRELKKNTIKPGMRIAVAVGSRGIGDLVTIVRSIINKVQNIGATVFIVGAMGSHGAGTEKGQRQILEGLGISEKNLGVEIITREETVHIGKLGTGENIYISKAAYDADGIILVNRIKPHTDFDGKGSIESGLCKLSVIGLGNHKGCVSMHRAGIHRFPEILIEASKQIFRKCKILFGVGIVENAYGKPFLIEAISPTNILNREIELLNLAKEKMAKIPFPEIDILIIDEIGKEISGSGADPNIIGRLGPKKYAEFVPKIRCVVILGLTQNSHGNATGIGFADIITQEVFDAIDREATYANCLAGGSKFGIDCARIPIIMDNEHEAMLAAMKICAKPPEKCKIVRIKNTKELNTIHISQAVRNEYCERE